MAIKQKIVDINQYDEIDKLLFLTLQDMMAIIPTTVDEVAAMEELLNLEINEFPKVMNDYTAVWNRGNEVLNRPTFFLIQRDKDTEKEMARAAREGKGISAEVEAVMKADREKSENNQ